jgi:hypothetical protein
MPSRLPIEIGASFHPGRKVFAGREGDMIDLLFLALGVFVLALFGVYAVGLRRI